MMLLSLPLSPSETTGWTVPLRESRSHGLSHEIPENVSGSAAFLARFDFYCFKGLNLRLLRFGPILPTREGGSQQTIDAERHSVTRCDAVRDLFSNRVPHSPCHAGKRTDVTTGLGISCSQSAGAERATQ